MTATEHLPYNNIYSGNGLSTGKLPLTYSSKHIIKFKSQRVSFCVYELHTTINININGFFFKYNELFIGDRRVKREQQCIIFHLINVIINQLR